ncbi:MULTISPECIES: DinI-like family protein [unclassified Vibrio]|nr:MULTISPECIES: DinI-like family protein [unclassified Vibrio]MCF7495070.1 DinI family protein [Vibrio sp. L5-1]WGW01538.1 DinI-like family protein [Vibrio sp. YMD68]
MRVDMIVKASGLPKGTFSLIEPEIQKRLSVLDPDVCVRIRKGENNHLDIMERDKTKKEKAHALLEEMFNEADEWLYN